MSAYMSISVSRLFVYPVKSCRGLALADAEVTRLGIRYDRQWMVVDERGRFVAQRGNGSGVGIRTMCLIGTAIQNGTLTLSAPGMPTLSLPLAGQTGPQLPVQVWQSHTFGVDQGDDVARWVTAFLSQERPGTYRVVRMDDAETRRAKNGDSTLAFADGYPFLVLSEASLADLNSRLAVPLPIDRFRPNIVIDGCQAYAEDAWDRLEVNDIVLHGMTTCLRCAITTTDQATGERSPEPLRTLATYRRTEDGVIFARNFNHEGAGVIRVGDAVVVA